MQAVRTSSRRLIILLFLILIWFGLGNAAFSFSLGKVAGGAIALTISIALAGAMLEGRTIRFLEGRPLRWESILPLSLVAVVVVYDAIQSLRLNQITLLGALYLPGLISLVQVVGLLFLAGALVWELGRLILSKA
jgi:hypothetical protein